MATLLIVTAAEPEFVAVVDAVLTLPAFTLPKVRDEFAREIVPLGDCFEEPVLRPAQPVRLHSAPRRINERQISLSKFLRPLFGCVPCGRKSLTRGEIRILPSIR